VTAWFGCVLGVILNWRRGPRALFALFGVVCALDAWLTGAWTPLAQDGVAMTVASVTFVIAGDLRYFVFIERALRDDHGAVVVSGTRWGAWGAALLWSLVVPAVMQLARAAGVARLEPRWTFLVYELAFFALAVVLRAVILPRRLAAKDDATRALVLRLTTFEIVQYGLWAAADVVLIFTKADVGHLLRMAPNLMYYAFFLPFAALVVPPTKGAGGPKKPTSRAVASASQALSVFVLGIFFVVSSLGLVACSKKPADTGRTIAFVRDGKLVRSLSLAELVAAAPPETVAGFDPYYGKPKTFRAMPLRALLEKGFEGQGVDLAKQEYVFRAKDGYAVPMRGALATEEGGAVAFEDTEVAGWEPIGPSHADPAPFYLVWKKPEQATLETHPRPWQLVTIEMARFDAVYPHTSPGAVAEGTPVAKGYGLFRDHCVQCHAINREGGRVGPDLNVPKNVLEYRPEDQVRAYVKNPRAFRYGNMPAHEFLTDADLDALLAYLHAMKDRKNDPGK
jgi:mono/diheme cytochrome c family protein